MAAGHSDNSRFAKSFQGAGPGCAAVWSKQPWRSLFKYLRDSGSAHETIEIIRCFSSGGHSLEPPAQRLKLCCGNGHAGYAPRIARAQR
jgi:hypothetical protein